MAADKKREILRFLKFTLFSASAGIIETLSFTLLNELTSWGYWACYLPALVLSVIWNFTLNRRYTFRSDCSYVRQLLLALLFYCFFTPASTLGGDYLAETAGWNSYLVFALTLISNFVLEYLYDKFVVFRGRIDTNAAARKKTGGSVDERAHSC